MISHPHLAGVLSLFGLDAAHSLVTIISHGLINQTWKVTTREEEYILQQINTNIFTNPEWIANNLQQIKAYLSHHHPEYLFVAPLPTIDGETWVKDALGKCFRLFPFVANSHTISTVSSPQQAFEAAKQFGKFTNLLSGFDALQLNITLHDFHNLSLRFQQFEAALKNADTATPQQADIFVEEMYKQQTIVATYKEMVNDKRMPLRVCHHDTKISNVLFDNNDRGLCVIDLDTVMPGYIISDIGDMLRTYLSPCSEEEKDMNKIIIRKDYFAAILQGYVSEMNALTTEEKALLIYSGKFMMYMQAMRFLTDFLNRNIYYPITYPLQNLVRAQNQLTLLKRFTEAEPELMKLV